MFIRQDSFDARAWRALIVIIVLFTGGGNSRA